MDKVFLAVLNMSFVGAFVIAAICLARLPLRKAPKIISYWLWAVAGFRLVFPFSVESMFSLIPFKAQPIPPDIAMQSIPRLDSGIPFVNNAVSSFLPAATPAASVNPLQIWTALGAYLWVIGIAVMLVYGVGSYLILKNKMQNALWVETNIYEADNVKSPFVLGVLKPRIYLPVGLSEKERGYIVRHEQTHIKRHDYIVKLAAYFILCLHWFNPLAWVAFLLMGVDLEMSCDESVLSEMGGETKKDYALSLLSLATERRFVGGSPLAFGEGGVKERIKRVLNFQRPSRVIIIVAIALAAVLIAGFSVNKSSGIAIPAANEIQYVTMNHYIDYAPTGEVIIIEEDEITQILNSLSGATKRGGISGMSVNDYPANDDYLLVRLYLENQMRTLYLYTDGADYIEEPYIGLYRARAKAGFNDLYSVYNAYRRGDTQDGEAVVFGQLTLDELRLLAEKGEALQASDLPNLRPSLLSSTIGGYNPTLYGVEGGYRLLVNFNDATNPESGIRSIQLESIWQNGGSGLDIRYNDVDEFIRKNPSRPADTVPSTTFQPRKWIDRENNDYALTTSHDLILNEFPGVMFSYTPERLTATNGNGEKELFGGADGFIFGGYIGSVFLADLNGDGKPEFCSYTNWGSGFGDSRVIVYDYHNDARFVLSDRGAYDYHLQMELGQLEVVQTSRAQMSDTLGIGRLAIINGDLVVFGIDRSQPITDPQLTAPSNYEPWTSLRRPLSDLPADYSMEQAIADSVVVIAYDGTHNQQQADLFYRDVASGGAAFMRVMQFTREGDAIITDYQYDGAGFTATHDNTRDKFAAQEDRLITTRTYKYLVQSNRPQSTTTPGAASDAPAEFYLSNVENIYTPDPDGRIMLIDDLWQIPPPSDPE